MDKEIKLTDRQKELLAYATMHELCEMIRGLQVRFNSWSCLEFLIPCDPEIKLKIQTAQNSLDDLHKALSHAHKKIMNKDQENQNNGWCSKARS